MKYFTIKEMCRSEKATLYKIDNTPSEDIVENLTEFIEEILDPLREAWGSPIKVNSGYRCKELNAKVGGSKTSSHMSGYAADLKPCNGKIDEFFEFVKKYFIDNKIDFDQIIDEYSGNAHWVHIGYKNSKGEQRKQIKMYDNGTYYLLKYDKFETEEQNNEN